VTVTAVTRAAGSAPYPEDVARAWLLLPIALVSTGCIDIIESIANSVCEDNYEACYEGCEQTERDYDLREVCYDLCDRDYDQCMSGNGDDC
jgi:hypothetical protein